MTYQNDAIEEPNDQPIPAADPDAPANPEENPPPFITDVNWIFPNDFLNNVYMQFLSYSLEILTIVRRLSKRNQLASHPLPLRVSHLYAPKLPDHQMQIALLPNILSDQAD